MFDIEAFKQYLLINADSVKANKIALTDLINAVANFSTTPDKHLGIASNTSSYYIKKVFYKLLINKPRSVGVQKYILNNYGYQVCYRCSKVLKLAEYNKKADRWNLLDNECRTCANSRSKDYRANNIEKELLRNRKYKKENRERIARNRLLNYRKNPKKFIEKTRKWQKLNSARVNAIQAKRRAAKLLATPKWLTIEHFNQIQEFYSIAKQLEKETNVKYHVDHIIPLQGIGVCGLHVPWNLQVIPATENMIKSNKHTE